MQLADWWPPSWWPPTRRQWLAAGAVGLAVLLAAPFVWWNWLGPDRFEDVELGRVPAPRGLPGELGPGEPPLALGEHTRVFLIFSTGTAGMSDGEAQRLRVNDVERRRGDRLTDTMMVLLTDPPSRQAALVSIPRDLWMHDRGHRINESFARHGTQAFVDDVSATLGLPIHHLVQVNFTAFADLVDAVGGVAIDVDKPLADLYSVLYVPEPGCWLFDGPDALAYARSRHTLTRRGGAWRADASASDFGRVARQQRLLAAAWEQLRGPGLVTRIPDLLGLASDLKIDDRLGIGDLLDLGRAFSDVAAGRVEAYTLPVVGQRIRGAAAQVLVKDLARPVFARIRSWPPGDDPPGDEPSDAQPGDAEGEDAEGADAEGAGTDEARAYVGRLQDATPPPAPTPEVSPSGLPTQESCTKATAQALPDPRGPLLAVARGRGGSSTGDDPAPEPTREPVEPEPSPSPTGTEPEDPDPGPAPVPTPDPVPTHDPSDCPLLDPECLTRP